MFDRDFINLGKVQVGEQQVVKVKYIGDEPFDPKLMGTSCSCTGFEYSPDTQEISLYFTPKSKGTFSVSGRYNNKHFVVVTSEVE